MNRWLAPRGPRWIESRGVNRMALNSIEQLSLPTVRDFLVAERVARMATADKSGAPHVIPICFWFDGAYFYFAIDEKPKRVGPSGLKRMRNIAENSRVAIVVDHYEDEWAQLAYVMIRGIAQIVEDPQEYMAVLRNLRDKYRPYRTMQLSPDRNPIVRITPERVNVWGERFARTPARQAS
jgi:coenzyme F420-0:L-glutamate ligase/coenzyme F420-1:gamma-L-glutamate ligase